MEWNHLPVAGGIYDQHPRLIDDWLIVFSAVSKQRQKEAERERAENAAKSRRKR